MSPTNEPIRNTSAGPLSPLDALPTNIEAAEAAGGREVAAANGRRLPTRGAEAWDLILAEGGTKGEQVPDDPIWTVAGLPPGWEVYGTDHSMWTTVRDFDGFARLKIFYKAAFYDRSAEMYVHSPPTTEAQERTLRAIRDEIRSGPDGRWSGLGVPAWTPSTLTARPDRSVVEVWERQISRRHPAPTETVGHRMIAVAPDGSVLSDESSGVSGDQ